MNIDLIVNAIQRECTNFKAGNIVVWNVRKELDFN